MFIYINACQHVVNSYSVDAHGCMYHQWKRSNVCDIPALTDVFVIKYG